MSHDEHSEVGTQDGETCGRYPEPDEDEPRGYKRKPCGGTMVRDDAVMIQDGFSSGLVCCIVCGALA